jgi:O-antigen/teichoic acid export membrane protein
MKGTAALAMLGLLPYGLVVAAGPQLFSYIFGAGWESAGVYARWLSVPSYFAFVAVPTLSAVPIIRLQGQFLAYEIAVTLISIISLAAGTLLLQSDVAAIAFMSIATALMIVLQIVWCLMHCETHTGSRTSLSA